MNDLFEQRLRDAVGRLPVPDAPPSVIERVIAERTAGVRVALPPARSRRRAIPSPQRITSIVAMAAVASVAAIVVVAVALVSLRGVHVAAGGAAADSVSSIEQFFVSGVGLATAYAQTPPSAPAAPPITTINGLSLGGKTFQYRIQLVDTAGRVTPDGDGIVRITDARYENAPAWRVEHIAHIRADAQQRAEGETLYVSKRDLRPLARVAHQAPYLRFSQITIQQRFVGDSVVGEMSTDGGIRRPIARPLPAKFGPYLYDALAPVALSGVGLGPGWRGSASIVGWAVVPRDVYYPATLRVIGEETIRTAAGSFDCWKLSASAGAEKRIQWVRKSDGVAVRSIDDGPPSPKGRREYVLVNP